MPFLECPLMTLSSESLQPQESLNWRHTTTPGNGQPWLNGDPDHQQTLTRRTLEPWKGMHENGTQNKERRAEEQKRQRMKTKQCAWQRSDEISLTGGYRSEKWMRSTRMVTKVSPVCGGTDNHFLYLECTSTRDTAFLSRMWQGKPATFPFEKLGRSLIAESAP